MKKVRMAFLTSFLVTILLFFTAPHNKTETDLLPYYEEFMTYSKYYCNKIETPNQFYLSFSQLKNDEIGVCYTFPFNKREIYIDTVYWSVATEEEKRQLLFHELTHCILNMDHVTDPENYMNPYLKELPTDVLFTQVAMNVMDYCKNH